MGGEGYCEDLGTSDVRVVLGNQAVGRDTRRRTKPPTRLMRVAVTSRMLMMVPCKASTKTAAHPARATRRPQPPQNEPKAVWEGRLVD